MDRRRGTSSPGRPTATVDPLALRRSSASPLDDSLTNRHSFPRPGLQVIRRADHRTTVARRRQGSRSAFSERTDGGELERRSARRRGTSSPTPPRRWTAGSTVPRGSSDAPTMTTTFDFDGCRWPVRARSRADLQPVGADATFMRRVQKPGRQLPEALPRRFRRGMGLRTRSRWWHWFVYWTGIHQRRRLASSIASTVGRPFSGSGS